MAQLAPSFLLKCCRAQAPAAIADEADGIDECFRDAGDFEHDVGANASGEFAHSRLSCLRIREFAQIDDAVGAETLGLLEAEVDAIDRDHCRATRLSDRHRVQPESPRTQHQQLP